MWRVWGEISEANIFLISGGVTYAILLALFPGLAAAVSVYGLFLDSSKVEQQVGALTGVLPEQSRQLLADELHKLAKSRRLCRCVRHPRCRQRPPLPLRRWPHRHAHRKADGPRRCLAHGPAPCRGTWHEGSDRLPHVSRNRPPILTPAAHWKTHRP
jgi:Virulence factor BrkB